MAATTIASGVITSVLHRLNQDATNPRYWSRAEILDAIWEGLWEATLITGHLQMDVNVILNGNSIQASPNHVAVLHIRIGNSSLQKYELDELDNAVPSWDSATQGTTPTIWTAVGVNQMLTHPRTSATGKVAVCTVLQLPATLTESSVIPLEDEYIQALINYAFSIARLKEGGVELKNALTDYDSYLKRIANLADRVEWKNAPEWTRAPRTLLAMSTPEQA